MGPKSGQIEQSYLLQCRSRRRSGRSGARCTAAAAAFPSPGPSGAGWAFRVRLQRCCLFPVNTTAYVFTLLHTPPCSRAPSLTARLRGRPDMSEQEIQEKSVPFFAS
jgi:hypothetical protein